MDELQQLMGDAYKEGMTLEDVSAFFKGKKFADLSTGNYVDKNKYNNEVSTLKGQLENVQKELNTKMTDEEKIAQSQKDKDAQIEELKKLLAANTISGNKNLVVSELTKARDTLGIKSDDKDFVSFVDNITVEDTDKSNTVAKYVSQLVANAYEKGKQDATKDAMGNFGKGKSGGSDGKDDIGSLGKKLAEQNKPSGEKFDYFK